MTWLYGIDDGKILYRTVFENIMRAGNWRAVVSGCTVSPGTGLSVNVGSGVILYDDVFVNVSSTALSLGNALSDRDRLVAIVYDFSDSSLKVLDRQQWINVGGTYYPMAPVLTQNQVAIALVRIRQNASSISTDDIMDMRAMFNIGVDMVGLRRILKAPRRDSGNILSAMQNESDELVSFILFLADDSVSASILNSSQITDAKAITWAHGILQLNNMKFFKVMGNSNLGTTRFNTILNNIDTEYLKRRIKEIPWNELLSSTMRKFYSRITNTSIRSEVMSWYDTFSWGSYTFTDLINAVTDEASDVTYSSNANVGYVIANNLTIGSGVTLTLGNGGFIVARNITNNGTVQGSTGFYVFVSGSASGGTYNAGAGGVGSMIRFNVNDQCGLGGNGGGLTANCLRSGCAEVVGGSGGNNGGGGGARQENCLCGCYDCCCSYNGYGGGSVEYTLWSVNDLKKYMMKMWFTRIGWIGSPFPWIGGANGGAGPGASGGAGGGEIIAVCYSISGTFRVKGGNGGNSASSGSPYGWVNAAGGGGGGGMVYVFRNTGSPSINVSGGSAGSQTECVNGAPQNGGSGFYAIYGWY